MADTTRWTLQQCADAAGKRTTPYPTCAGDTVAHDHRCAACGADLTGRRAKNTGLALIYCNAHCRTIHNRRWRSGPDESAALTMRNYSWGES